MTRFALAVLLILSGPSSWAQEMVRPSPAAAQDSAPQDKEARLKALASLLETFSNDEYESALSQVPESKARDPRLASRSAVLKSAYTNLAGLEYNKAAQTAPQQASAQYNAALERVSGSVGAAGGGAQEAGLAGDVLGFLGNAALNYWLKGGNDFLGGKGPRAGAMDKFEQELVSAQITPDRAAELHFKKGESYEAAAAAITPETPEERLEKKKARLKELAVLLQTATDDEYTDVLAGLPPKISGQAQLASRGGLLKSAYVTLAALEYKDAAKSAPRQASARYSQDFERVSRDGGKSLAVNPETLQEAGWFTNMLTIGAVGGIGYLVYENQRIKKKSRDQQAQLDVKPRQGALECPPATRLDGDRCIGEMSCPAGTRKSGEQCIGDRICPTGTSLEGEKCMGGMVCPDGTQRSGEECRGAVICPEGTHKSGNQCIGDRICPAFTALSGGQCVGERACPGHTVLKGEQCVGEIDCPGSTKLVQGECRGAIVCPGSTKLVNGECRGKRDCPQGTSLQGDEDGDKGQCLGKMICPEGSKQDDGKCRGDLACPGGTQRKGEQCIGDISCAAGTRRVGDACLGELVCPSGTERAVSGCVAKILCPAGTTLSGILCVAPVACTAPARLEGGQCLAPSGCRAPATLSGNVCLGPIRCPAGTMSDGSTCTGPIVCPSGTMREGNGCRGNLICPSGTVVQGTLCQGANKCPPGTTLHFDNPKLILCVACAKDQRLLRGVCVHCSKSPWGCNNEIHNVSRAADIHASVDEVEGQLVNASLSLEHRADLRHLLGSLYEDLATDAIDRDAVAQVQPVTESAPAAAPTQEKPRAPAKVAVAPSPAPKESSQVSTQDEFILWDGSLLKGEVMTAGPDKIVMKIGKGVSGVMQGSIRALILRGNIAPDELSGAASGEFPLILRADGTSSRGRMVSATPRQFSFQTQDGTVFTLARETVRAVIFPPKGK